MSEQTKDGSCRGAVTRAKAAWAAWAAAPRRSIDGRCRGGFTLIELVLVLVILTTLATIALNALEPEVHQARFETTQQTLSNVDNAIIRRTVSGNGNTNWSGFYADMGRLPRAEISLTNVNHLTLRELWDPSLFDAATRYGWRNATADNVSNADTLDADGQAISFDSEVRLAFGWRGPYLQLPAGGSELKDGWGSPLISTLDGSAPSALRGVDFENNLPDLDVSSVGQEIMGVRSFGADNAVDDGDESVYEQDLPAPGRLALNPVALNPTSLTGFVSGKLFVQRTRGAAAADLIVQLYYPDPANAGKLRIERATVTPAAGASSPSYDAYDYQFLDHGGDELTFPIGVRLLRAYWNDTNDSGDFSNDGNDPPHRSIATRFTLDATHNPIDLTIP